MIYCFSGQGNSRLVALTLAKKLSQEVTHITADTLDTAATLPAPDTDCENVWVFPVHAWGVPRVVEQFIATLATTTAGSNAVELTATSHKSISTHHMIATCGDDIGRTDRMWAKMIRVRGWHVGGMFSLTMPNTYVCLPGFDVDSKTLATEKLANAEVRLDEIVERIAACRANGVRMVTPGAMPWVKSRILRPLFNAFLMSPRPFRCDKAKCGGCGTCVTVCPMHNITMGKWSTPDWSRRCTMCLACYHRCPSGAIAYGHATVGKGRQHTTKF
jgi:NAD-dependent dihydropyrimidine dehydrogenase PreA subunit